MVESGTLLRCYTSKRGIEGSNPSSSALSLRPFAGQTHRRKMNVAEALSSPFDTSRDTSVSPWISAAFAWQRHEFESRRVHLKELREDQRASKLLLSLHTIE